MKIHEWGGILVFLTARHLHVLDALDLGALIAHYIDTTPDSNIYHRLHIIPLKLELDEQHVTTFEGRLCCQPRPSQLDSLRSLPLSEVSGILAPTSVL